MVVQSRAKGWRLPRHGVPRHGWALPRAEARTHVPRGGTVVVTTTITRVTVRVAVTAAILPGSPMTIDLSAESTAVLEPGASG